VELLRGHWRSLALLVVGLAVVALVIVPAVLMWVRVHPRLVPVADDPGRHGLAYDEVAFASPLDGVPLRGWHIRAPEPTGRTLVVVPGIDDNRLAGGATLALAPALVAEGWDVLAFDLRAQGESGGDTLSFGAREQDDVLGAVAVARARGARHVAVLGFSMGASSALLAAARTPDIEALVLDSAFARWDETLRAELREDWRVPEPLLPYAVFLYEALSGTDAGAVAPVEVIDRVVPRPMLFIAGTEDRAVSPADGEALATAAGPSAEYVLVPGAAHVGAYQADPAGYTKRLLTSLDRAVPPGP
jgi:uncharacterized protein